MLADNCHDSIRSSRLGVGDFGLENKTRDLTGFYDFILESADHVLRHEFGRALSNAGVHVLDPFTGTEIVLLAYYIAAIHIPGHLLAGCPRSRLWGAA